MNNVSKSLFTFSDAMIAAAQAHARAEFPKESCGLVVAGAYIPCTNVAADPLRDFEIDPAEQLAARSKGVLEAVIHSHPFVPQSKDDKPVLWPTQSDMEGQLATNVPWAIVPLDEDSFANPIMWGDGLPMPALIGRSFVPGVTDCYSLIRDIFRLGREGCAAQGIDWPYEPIELPEVARDAAWENDGKNLYVDHFKAFGFTEITFGEARPGDAFLISVNHTTLNHAGLLVGNNLLVQHLPLRLSRREPAGIWARAAVKWLRYTGAANGSA